MKNISFAASKICTFEEEQRLMETWKMFSKTYTSITGWFDGLDKNDIDFINKAAQKADYLIVHIMSDEDIHKSNGEYCPKHNLNERALIIANLLQVDAVAIEDEAYKKSQEIYTQEKYPNIQKIKVASSVVHEIASSSSPNN